MDLLYHINDIGYVQYTAYRIDPIWYEVEVTAHGEGVKPLYRENKSMNVCMRSHLYLSNYLSAM